MSTKLHINTIRAITGIALIYLLTTVIYNSIFINYLRSDTITSLQVETMANYGEHQTENIPISWYLSSPYLLSMKDMILCDYTRQNLAMLYGKYSESELDNMEARLNDTASYGYYLAWKAEEAMAQMECSAEQDFGIDLLKKDLSDISWIEDIKTPTKDAIRFAALRSAAGVQISYLYEQADKAYNDAISDKFVILTSELLRSGITLLLATGLALMTLPNRKTKKGLLYQKA